MADNDVLKYTEDPEAKDLTPHTLLADTAIKHTDTSSRQRSIWNTKASSFIAIAVILVFSMLGVQYLRSSEAAPVNSARTTSPVSDAGAKLPVSYNLASLTGSKLYVAPNGSDTAGKGNQSAPYASVTRAVSAAASGDSIVIRGGTYRQGGISVPANKSLTITAYPGETPIFNGSRAVPSGWISEGTYKYTPYTPIPVTNGSGIDFIGGQNLSSGGVGKYPDQVWIGATKLTQVTTKTALTTNKFFVDATNKRLYLIASDAAKPGIEVSDLRTFGAVHSPGTTLRGLRIMRYSNTASDYGVLRFSATADNSVLTQTDISDAAFITISYDGNSNLLTGNKIDKVTITGSNWMGISTVYTDNLTVTSLKATGMNSAGEFTSSPQSGAIKTSRTRHMKVVNSVISNNNSHGLWFDQSNYDIQVANNEIIDNSASGVFFEISDNLLLINNYIKSTGKSHGARLVGASGLKVVNNTFVGGGAPVGIYTDNRSIAGCSDPARPKCANSYGSDRDTVRARPATLDWIPRLDLMANNIIAHPTGTGYCGALVAFCITGRNETANVPMNTIIHKADTKRGIPRTQILSNVYAGNGTTLIRTPSGSYKDPAAFAKALAGAPVGLGSIEAGSLNGTSYVDAAGTPTTGLANLHAKATAIPADAAMNEYLPAGYRHYGVSYR